ncbi:single-stranded DNA-binding protein [Alloprevotella tannerae]|jgi:single-strand binding protein|uniref:single-stranded DNA-binding protein n=1 Tax=Alloprevotella tannerae TaxID=76122 RepID=UPI0025E1668E|nr:single-stranded DNA-binding protein [Alloprevotella tannerae]
MSLNKVLLIGNVGREPEIHYVKDGVCTASLSLATSTPGYTLSSGTQVPERTEWHRVLLWRRMAEITEKYVHKGDKLYIEGELRTRNYTDKKGVTRYVTEIWAEKLELLTPKSFQQTATTMPSDATDTDTSQPPF